MELVRCAGCGAEIYRPSDDADRECLRCFRERERPGAVHIRVDDWENVGTERNDATKGHIISLNNVAVSLGKDKRGRERFGHRPATVADFPTRRAFLDEAKRQGLSPGDGNRYRTVGQRG